MPGRSTINNDDFCTFHIDHWSECGHTAMYHKQVGYFNTLPYTRNVQVSYNNVGISPGQAGFACRIWPIKLRQNNLNIVYRMYTVHSHKVNEVA